METEELEAFVDANARYVNSVRKRDTEKLRLRPGSHWLCDGLWTKSIEHHPLNLDIGAGMGRFLLGEAEKHPERFYLGIDPDYQCARKVLEKLSRHESLNRPLPNVRFHYGSVYDSLEEMPEKCLFRIYLNYPDPWFKKRHKRRRIVSPLLFDALKPHLLEGGEIFIQTDDTEYAEFIGSILAGLTGFLITENANPLFGELTPTLYQEKAAARGQPRFCFHLRYSSKPCA